MPTYSQYLIYSKNKGFQPLSEKSFNSLISAGFNPISNEFPFNF
jgi:hypothetical protein